MVGAGQVIGGGMQLGGVALGAAAADRRQKKLEQIAQTPGLDLTGSTKDAVSAGANNLAGAQSFASGVNRGSLADITSALESAIPGYSPMQKSRSDAVGSMLRGELPPDVAAAISRGGAAHALEGGYGGSGMARNLVARDLGLSSLDLIGKGMTGMEGILRSTRLPNFMQANDILNLTASGVGNLRSNERTQKLDMLLGAANAPKSSDVWAKGLQDMGGSLAGSGAGAGGGLGGVMSLVGGL